MFLIIFLSKFFTSAQTDLNKHCTLTSNFTSENVEMYFFFICTSLEIFEKGDSSAFFFFSNIHNFVNVFDHFWSTTFTSAYNDLSKYHPSFALENLTCSFLFICPLSEIYERNIPKFDHFWSTSFTSTYIDLNKHVTLVLVFCIRKCQMQFFCPLSEIWEKVDTSAFIF